METEETRRRTGDLIEAERKKRFPRISKREAARRAGISETWYRAITTGLTGEEPRPASDETWVAIADAVGADVRAVFGTLGRPLPEGVGGMAPPGPHEVRRYLLDSSEEIWQLILEDVEAEADDLTDEEAQALTERALENARNQTIVFLRAERDRIQRRREKERRKRAGHSQK